VAVEPGMVLAGIAGFRRSFITSLADYWKIGTHLTDSLKRRCGCKFNTIVEDGVIHAKPVQ
jgi:hypothetical protein